MIDGYKIKDGKVIVVNYDENDTVLEEEREYQDNIEELLIAENIEEHLDNLKDKTEKDIKNNEYRITHCKNDIGDAITGIVGFTATGAILCLLKPWIPFLVAFLGSLSFFGIKYIIPLKKKMKNTRKEIAGQELVLEGILEQIKKNQRDLRRLRSDDQRESDNIRTGYRQFDFTELEEIDKYLELWYHVGANEENYIWYQKNDWLDEYLGDTFNQEEVKTLKRIFNRNNKRR